MPWGANHNVDHAKAHHFHDNARPERIAASMRRSKPDSYHALD